VVWLLSMISLIAFAETSKPFGPDHSEEGWSKAGQLLDHNAFSDADTLLRNTYSAWKQTFTGAEEFASGGNILFYPYARNIPVFDSVFCALFQQIKKVDQKDSEQDFALSSILLTLGRSFFLIRDFEKALEVYQTALEIQSGNDANHPMMADLYESIGDVYEEVREYKTAIAHYSYVKDLHKKNFGTEHRRLANVYEKLGVSYSHLFDEKFFFEMHGRRTVDISMEYKNKALEINNKLLGTGNPYSAVNHLQIALDKYYEAWYHRDQEIRRKLVQESIDISHMAAKQLLKTDPENVKLGNCFNLLGSSYQVLGNDDSCMYYYQKTLKTHLQNRGFHHPMTIYAASNIGKKHVDFADTDSALYYYQKSLIYCVPEFQSEELDDNPHPGQHVVDYSFLIAALLGKKDNLEQKFSETGEEELLEMAYKTSSLSVDFCREYMKQEHLAVEYGIWAGTLSRMAKNTLELAYLLDSLEASHSYVMNALQILEESKYYSIRAELLHEHSAENEDHSFERPVNHLLAEISETKNNLMDELEKGSFTNPSRIIRLQNEYLMLRKKQKSQLKENASVLNLSHTLNEMTDLTLKDLQENLDENESILYYVVSRSKLWILHFCKDKLTVASSDIGYRLLEEKVERMLTSIKNQVYLSSQPEDAVQDFYEASGELYHILFPKRIREQLHKDRHLIIIPDETIGFIPFDALVMNTDGPAPGSFKEMNFLIHHYQVSHQYFLSDLCSGREKMSNKFTYSGFAPVYDSVEVALLENQNIRPYTRSLGELKANTKEVSEVAGLFNGNHYIGKMASEATFHEVASHSEILHLAMHAVVDLVNPMSSMLLFSQKNQSQYDNQFKLHEIYAHPLNSKLVVLSACNTGYGKLVSGKGVISLSRAFLQTGAQSVVSTLWWADDEATKSIAVDFFRHVKDQLPLDEALRKSKLSFLQQADPVFSHPYFWANFVLTGNKSPISTAKGINWLLISCVILPIIASLLLIRRYRKSKRTG
jgi:CHAT domain-containing protein